MLVVVLGVLGVLVWRLPEGHTLAAVAQALLVGLPVVGLVVQYSYDRIDAFHLWVTKLRYWLTDQHMRWSFRGEFEVAESAVAWKLAESTIDQHLGPDDDMVVEGPDKTAWHIGGLTLRLERDTLFDGGAIIRAHWMELPRSYRVWRRALSETVVPLMEDLERALESGEGKYVVRARFDGGNPYFGLLVVRHREDAVHRYDILLKHRVGRHESNVRVTADGIEVVGFNLHAVHQAAQRYLALGAIRGD
jgi:hypothetical protein